MVMDKTLEIKGYASYEEASAGPGYPDSERMKKGPVAVIECLQEIPCDPCRKACPYGAIQFEALTDLPTLDEEKCIGCAKCLSVCPGQAIFLIDDSKEKTQLTFPYEYLPLPKKGQAVQAVNRAGELVCSAEIIRVRDIASQNKTRLVTIAFDKAYVHEVRFIRKIKEGETHE